MLFVAVPAGAVASRPGCPTDCFQEYNFCLNNCSIYNNSCAMCVVNYNACLGTCAPSQASTTPDGLDLSAAAVTASAATTCTAQPEPSAE